MELDRHHPLLLLGECRQRHGRASRRGWPPG
jgi:hypothetical protein